MERFPQALLVVVLAVVCAVCFSTGLFYISIGRLADDRGLTRAKGWLAMIIAIASAGGALSALAGLFSPP